MTRIIANTNIMVDDFDFCKSFPKDTFHHFLTHFHSDHYEGITPLWDYGAIHCSHQTKKFLMDKYPKLKRVESYDYYKFYTISIVKDKIDIEFAMFDAKHIPGAAMILFRGYMGTILFTGDFRYEYSMIKENSLLFPPRLRQYQEKQDVIENMRGISIKVDEMIFDNTYCNKAFTFQTEPFIATKMIAIIEKNRDKKLIYIAMGALGKHRILMKICEHFQTSIVVSKKQMKKIELANLRTDFLTTNESEGYIHLISKKNRAQIVETTKKGSLGDNFICIDTDFLMLEHQSPDQINYIVPYSLHSNYIEMTKLIRMIQPSILRKIVIPFANFKQVRLKIVIDNRVKFAKYLDFVENIKESSQSGYTHLVKQYSCIYELSTQYLQWFKPQQQKQLMVLLGLGDGKQNHDLRKRKPVILTQQELSMRLKFGGKNKKSLKEIAGQLNAVHKNQTIQYTVKQHNEKKQDRQLQKLYDSQTEDYSQSHQTTTKTSKPKSLQPK